MNAPLRSRTGPGHPTTLALVEGLPPTPPPRPVRSAEHQKACDDLRRVKSARFNASNRLAKKDAASIKAMAVAGLFGFVLPYFTEVFGASISDHLSRVLQFTGFVSGSLSLVVGLIEQSKDYRMRSAALHNCGLQVAKVLRRLETQTFRTDEEMHPLLQEYETALAECRENHDDIDMELVQARTNLRRAKNPASAKDLRRRIAWLEWKVRFEVYRLYLLIWLFPSLIAVFVYVAFHP